MTRSKGGRSIRGFPWEINLHTIAAGPPPLSRSKGAPLRQPVAGLPPSVDRSRASTPARARRERDILEDAVRRIREQARTSRR